MRASAVKTAFQGEPENGSAPPPLRVKLHLSGVIQVKSPTRRKPEITWVVSVRDGVPASSTAPAWSPRPPATVQKSFFWVTSKVRRQGSEAGDWAPSLSKTVVLIV